MEKVEYSKYEDRVADVELEREAPQVAYRSPSSGRTTPLRLLYLSLCIFILFLNFFVAQYDKFVLSYFQAEILDTLNLSSSNYGLLSGYATGIVFALLAIPVAFIADYTESRVWVLCIATLWWSVCVIFQGLSHNFWQILLARIAMGIGQAPAEALSVSLISDLVDKEWIFLAESVLYVGVYVGEAVSGQIATAFTKTNTSWTEALKAIGIVGIVIGVLIRLVLREPPRQSNILANDEAEMEIVRAEHTSRIAKARVEFSASWNHIFRSRSLWLLTLSSGARQFSGNVFGYYMPSYLTYIYPDQVNLLSNYGIIVGAVGSVAVIAGGIVSSYFFRRNVSFPLYITGIGGMISAPFVICMILSLQLAKGDQTLGTHILYGTMAAAYLTAELWLGAFASLLALLLPPKTKTFGLAIYTAVIVLIYSSAPQIIGLALRNYDETSAAYIEKTKVILAVLIPVGYWIGGIGFLLAIREVWRDLRGDMVPIGGASALRKLMFWGFWFLLAVVVIALFTVSLVYR
ncbi:hypothetical protein MMC25_004137 [Agyrium rufum]|nr:hypothetical protein [Agyrium rufum]